jgi:hypothetical protein
MDPRAQVFLSDRAKARAAGDHNMVHALNVELNRIGYREPVQETTRADEELEQAVPVKPRRGRQPKPRCEHGRIPDRCLDCNEAA